MFLLADCNNFFVSCERVFNPVLNNKAVVVLSNNDGCVIARSNEAKALGIPMGAPAYQYEGLFRFHQVQVYSANFRLYGDMSQRVMGILREMAMKQEIYSIDECFLFLDLPEKECIQEAEKMRKRVAKWTGIPISIGIAPTKALCKLANQIAKRYPKETQGIHCINNAYLREKALRWVPIEEIWGIGRRHAKTLNRRGIKTGWDFIHFPAEKVQKLMTSVGLKLWKELQGESCLRLEEPMKRQSIASTRSFATALCHYDEIRERIVTFTNTVAHKLRDQESSCRGLVVFISTGHYQREEESYYNSTYIRFSRPLRTSAELIKYATRGLKEIFRSGYRYKKAGVILHEIEDYPSPAIPLFDESNKKLEALQETVDQINKHLPEASLIRPSSEIRNKPYPTVEQKHKSPFLKTNEGPYSVHFDIQVKGKNSH